MSSLRRIRNLIDQILLFSTSLISIKSLKGNLKKCFSFYVTYKNFVKTFKLKNSEFNYKGGGEITVLRIILLLRVFWQLQQRIQIFELKWKNPFNFVLDFDWVTRREYFLLRISNIVKSSCQNGKQKFHI